MSKSLTPAVSRQIIAFNPAEPSAPSVMQFCGVLGVSGPSFYKVRDRFARAGNAAMNPRSRGPKEPSHPLLSVSVGGVWGPVRDAAADHGSFGHDGVAGCVTDVTSADLPVSGCAR